MNTQQKNTGFWHFTREFFRDPRGIGALFPSSPFLARRMAGLVPSGEGAVVELGPGLGPVTHALLEGGIAKTDLILIERSANMVQHLRQEFPGVEVIHGDAAELATLIGDRLPVRAIVSSLPLRTIPPKIVGRILGEFPKCARRGTAFIQFTYHPLHSCTGLSGKFTHQRASYVWRNLPPARVDCFHFGD
ncbi:phosphatidylethanolamine N-methyltransferase [Acidithiobacillus sp. CV18-2]|uniref:Phosphatidylethanolamine N-methyltransferase n=1 Tax=Igneacidithiobacillus copahuensis TaxID=2724909 RepID=A0AAE3CJI9_9PROT|nr:phosphatidylethanolamine N-methyltransferase [Igneacidithiobacillus copahuensis]MBU2753617.1 phosphatidylethanolamine N-methyltransferase [Acidithiobacillus sp. CV18-3]MBU2758531.1 phosphatidylethanolamine N-methyltransferase [Acidithiobacillus sp. BN09-2]MBU2776335.1 phosphatidylethanolamine N-methyltransferase [Acidithiobacillus sp. CV18-2]MBU2795251.1 phosphatidylethanolamine N-methyltransferase [Acidithiobacillus sp. VAN18-2]MBU2799523.1 phosphatidylethanolamine N-methyltransferase [Aci